MTVSNQTASITYTGNGVQDTFTYNFLIPYQVDLVTPAVAVYVTTDDVAVLLNPSEFLITGVASPAGGTVVYPLSGSPLSSSQSIQINRALPYIQPVAFPNQGLLPQSIEDGFDNMVLQMQQLAALQGGVVNVQPAFEAWPFALTDETTVITDTGVYVTFQWPYAFTVERVYASLTAPSDTGAMFVAINNNGVDILSTDITIAEGAVSSLFTGTTQPVVSSPSLSAEDVVTLEILVAGANAAGLKVVILGRQS